MTVPDWRSSTAGTRVRVALWLHSEIGEGGIFTKQQLRDNFPNVEQVDRRMRDLREDGWVIATYQEDRSLAPSGEELRLKTEGGAVWEKGYTSQRAKPLDKKARQAIFAADGYSCIYCGIGPGERYSDSPLRTAQLTVARVESLDGSGPLMSTSCERCHSSGAAQDSIESVAEAAELLTPEQRERLARWVSSGRRDLGPEHLLWGRYRRLPAAARDSVAKLLLET